MQRTRTAMKRAAVVSLLLLFSATGCAKIISAPLTVEESELRPADAIVVLGYGPPVDESGEVNPELRRRVEKGVELYRRDLAPVMIMTGGNTYKDFYESEVMKEVAVSMGVPEEAVICEREAESTIGNAGYTSRIMEERGMESCIVVSSPYHLKRAAELFRAAGLEVRTAGSKVPDDPAYTVTFSMYEYLVRLYYLFIDEEEMVRNARETGG
ncbi:MAG: YdcF family protein [bacterium]